MTTMEREEILVGAMNELVAGKFTVIRQGALNVGITRLADGSLRAVRNFCPHKGAPICRGTIGGTWPPSAPGELEYHREGEILVCPWHGFEYDLKTGEELYRKAPTRLRFYEAVERAGKIYLVRYRREPGGSSSGAWPDDADHGRDT